MFRSNSFNINRSSLSGSLSRSKSVSDIGSESLDHRVFIKIKEVNAEEFSSRLDFILLTSMKDPEWYCEKGPVPLDPEQNRWNNGYERAHGGFRTMDLNLSYGNYEEESQFFVVYYKIYPVGAAQCTPKKDNAPSLLNVDQFSFHLGIENCECMLMEHLVNHSQELGLGGRLKDSPLPDTIPFYYRMGFTPLDFNAKFMYLDPATSPQWYFKDGKYKYCGR
ncbi:hypothetical protein FE392_09255 [Xenorhabdus sp. 12]|uniref:N-acetyltransferase n=1 Tax=Xenorhabdus santafensis TaxID=2582833 RepID=A0ABU4S9R8_9GAMM|nr:hypothetical protein [Xenorhabdus sp. 12]MDX7987516.1 hypothetical protein [Xenorhabdus sp. 12]